MVSCRVVASKRQEYQTAGDTHFVLSTYSRERSNKQLTKQIGRHFQILVCGSGPIFFRMLNMTPCLPVDSSQTDPFRERDRH